MYTFTGENPTKLYYVSLMKLVEEGYSCSPRGKLIKELRPSCFEFENPYNRVTFLGARRINPFFQVAESLWILSGRADVEWLCKFNANMKSFSDDGHWFNAPYGERIRSWGKNSAHNIIINPVDQLTDAYIKLLNDKDTRQAVIVISNPSFDNSRYTIVEQGKDIACNLVITFKIRDNKLNMTVFNRSNDESWGVFGANLCQFTTIQEVLLSWLKNSGKPEFVDLEIGTYCQITDSLHIYLDDYGAKCTTDILQYYKEHDASEVDADFTCKHEPRMSLNAEQFDKFLSTYWSVIDPYVSCDKSLEDKSQREQILEVIDYLYSELIVDEYWYFVIKSMIAYRLVKLDYTLEAMEIINNLRNCQWKISMVNFMKNFIHKVGRDELRVDEFDAVVDVYKSAVNSLQQSLIHSEYSDQLGEYLKL